MEKMNCDIIRDLIPSYVDGICSEATKKCVEEHLKDCDKCRQTVSLCQNNVLSEEKLERQGLDGLKKINKTLKLQSLACYLSLVLIAFLGIQIFGVNHYYGLINNHSYFFYVICILACLLTCLGYKGRKNLEKRDWILGAVSLLANFYTAGLLFYAARELAAGAETLFGRELLQSGPFMERQLIAVFLLQLAFLLYNSFCILKRDKSCNWLLCLNMMGMFLTLEYDLFLKGMDSRETLLHAVTIATYQTVGVGALGIAASFLITTLRKPKTDSVGEALRSTEDTGKKKD